MSSKYIPRESKEKISITLDKSVVTWIESTLPRRERSAFLNKLAKDYITRERELTRRGKIKAETR